MEIRKEGRRKRALVGGARRDLKAGARRGRLTAASAHLDPEEERALAEEGLSYDEETTSPPRDDLRAEYSFRSLGGGVRGKYVAALEQGAVEVVPAPTAANDAARGVLGRLDHLIRVSLETFAKDTLGTQWCGKENDWVNRFAHGYLLRHVRPGGVLHDPAQIGIEVAVPQPPGYLRPSTRRDLVIWSEPGDTCWDATWQAVHHPLAIVEWKVHRPLRRNPDQVQEREWLRRYTRWQHGRLAYAVEVDLGCEPSRLICHRFARGNDSIVLQIGDVRV